MESFSFKNAPFSLKTECGQKRRTKRALVYPIAWRIQTHLFNALKCCSMSAHIFLLGSVIAILRGDLGRN